MDPFAFVGQVIFCVGEYSHHRQSFVPKSVFVASVKVDGDPYVRPTCANVPADTFWRFLTNRGDFFLKHQKKIN